MKSILVKMMMPVAAFVLASAGAVSTHSSAIAAKSDAVLTQGWYRPAGGDCTKLRMCNNISGNVCKQNNVQAFILTGSTCTELLYHQ